MIIYQILLTGNPVYTELSLIKYRSVVFLTKVRMELTKTDIPRMSNIGHLSSTYQKLLGKDEFNR